MKQKIFTAAVLILVGLTSCKKEGCTDIDATNFDAEAKKDNGACTYEGNTVFWYGEDMANFLVDDGAVSLTYYVDNKIVGSSAAAVYWNGISPNCGASGLVTVSKDLGNAKTQAFTYEIVDQDGWIYWQGILNFNANTCLSFELN